MRALNLISCIVVFSAALMFATFAQADTISMTLDHFVATTGSNNPAGPWASATFTQVNSTTVSLVLQALPGLGSSYLVSWGFNSSVPVSDLTITAANAFTAGKVASYNKPQNFFEPIINLPPYEYQFSFGITFLNSHFELNPPWYYGGPGNLTFTITSTVPISAATFDIGTPQAPHYLSEGLISDTGGGLWGAATTAAVLAGSPGVVPTPAGFAGGLLLLSGIGLAAGRMRRQIV